MSVQNAIIEETTLGYEDHGILTCWLHLDYGDSSHQGFGGYGLDKPHKENGKFVDRRGSEYGTQWIIEILKVVGVEKWEDLKGKYIRVEKTDNPEKWSSNIVRIGNITKDEWFSPKELGERYSFEFEKPVNS